MNLAELIDRYRDAIARAVISTYPPLYDAEVRRSCGVDLGRLIRRPLGAQADAIQATALSLQRHTGTIVVGEMGTGKSYLAAAAAYVAGCRRVLVVCPPHMVRKWQREILRTVPGASAAIVRTITDLERAKHLGGMMQFVICSRERAKLGYRWVPAVVQRPAHDEGGGLARDEVGKIAVLLSCPTCFTSVTDEEDVPLTWSELRVKKRHCSACGGALWQADRTGPRRFPLADYVRRRLPGFSDLLVLDEGHEFKARGSAQGLAAEALAGACGRTLMLTGTLFGGYSSTLFYLLRRFSPTVRREFGYRDEPKWVSRYGIVERIMRRHRDDYGDDGRHSKRRSYLTRTIEKPGVSPAVLFHLIGNTVFLRLSDVARDLPPYTERVAICSLDRGANPDDPEAPSQASCYRQLAQQLRQATMAALGAGSKRLLATYLQALLAYPDACTRGETVMDPNTGSVIAHAPALPGEVLYPKEQALVELAHRERERGRRLLVYITHTESRDISPRLRSILERAGIRVAVLKADTVAADRREEWVAARVREGVDVLICHPRLVQTGLDLIDWPSICWYETEYSIYVLRQASRRSWRIGQRQPVEITFLVYEGTLQAEALALVSAKMRSALMIEGELPKDGLAALEGDGDDVLLTLARRLAEQSADAGQSLEGLFAHAQDINGADSDFLVDSDWESAVSSPEAGSTHGGVADPWQAVFDDGAPSHSAHSAGVAGASSGTPGRVVSFEEFGRLVRRPKRRRRPVPEGQLTLFNV